MSEEDIEFINGIRDYLKEEKEKYGRNTIYSFEYQRIIEIIDKLRKENEKLKQEIGLEKLRNNDLYNQILIIEQGRNNEFISKDTIRNKIKELTGEIHRTKKGRIILKDIKRLAKIEVLEELLGE